MNSLVGNITSFCFIRVGRVRRDLLVMKAMSSESHELFD